MKLELKHLIFVALLVTVTACGTQSESSENTVKVLEVEQVSDYTYLLVKNKKSEFWVAVPTMQASPGRDLSLPGGNDDERFL